MIAEYSFLVLPQITLTFCPDFIGDGSIKAERRTSEYLPQLQHTLASLLSMFVDFMINRFPFLFIASSR